MLKHIAENIPVPLTFIYNLSISECIFPELFKLAVIKPLYKNGINNYRPISIISKFAKILEKIIKSMFLEINYIFLETSSYTMQQNLFIINLTKVTHS